MIVIVINCYRNIVLSKNIMHIAMTPPKIKESRRRRDLIIDSRLLIPGIESVISWKVYCVWLAMTKRVETEHGAVTHSVLQPSACSYQTR